MLEVRRAAERYQGGDEAAGIDTRHAFSFSGHYDPDNLRLGPLVACNEERLAPGAGFAEHPHRDLEIVTWVLAGELTHEDSTGHTTLIRPGDLQRLTTGRGVRHQERNDGTEPLRFLQMWLVPAQTGGDPAYEVVRNVADGAPYPLPRTAAVLRSRRLAPGESWTVPRAGWCYLHVWAGTLSLDGRQLAPGDAARLTAPYGAPVASATAGPQGTRMLEWALDTAPDG